MKRKQIFLLACVLILLCGLFSACKKTTEQFNLTMNANNGSDASVVQVDKGTSYTLPVPTRDGYEFGGWYTKADFTGDAVTSVTVNADTTVYAKWDKFYTLTLDPAGGTLGTTTIRLKAGDKLAEKLASLVPQKENSKFGAWMLNGEELGADAVMGAEDATLVAKYMVKYYVEIFTQNETLDGYAKLGETIEDYAYTGTAFTSAQTLKGFTEVTKADSVTRLVISDDIAKNQFRHYFDRASYTLTFVSNFPDGSANERKTEKLYYGVKTHLPFVSFEMNGYLLEGWSLSAGGEMIYSSHVLDGKLINADTAAVEEIVAEGNITLYAVWSKGCTDLFGGADVMYLSAGEKDTIYLSRGTFFMKGFVTGNAVFFEDAPESFPEAVLNSDGETFLYLDTSRAEISATLYELGKGLNELVKLYFSSDNTITYSEKESEDSATTSDSKGKFFFDREGNMYVAFTSGPLSGKTITFVIGTLRVSDTEKRTVFQVRNDAEIALGNILFFTVKNNTIVADVDDNGAAVNNLTLNGYGIAHYNTGSQTVSYYYLYDAEAHTITLMNDEGRTVGILRLMEINGELGYMLYNKSLDVSYTLSDGAVLTLDGMRTVTYQKDGVTVTGYFATASSALGGTLLSFKDLASGKDYLFMITTTVEELPVDPTDPDGETKKETKTTVEQKDAGYAEFYYKNASNTYRHPLFVFETADRTVVTIYGYSKTGTYYKIASATLVYDKNTGTYTLTITDRYTVPEGTEFFTDQIDFSKVQSCVLMLDTAATEFRIHFWFNYNNGVETVDMVDAIYTGADSGKLTLVAGLAVYQVNGETKIGKYSKKDALVTVVFSDQTLYFTVNEEDNTYSVSEKTSVTYYVAGKDGMINKTLYLITNPDATANYCVVTEVNGETVITEYVGKLYSTGNTSLTNFKVYRFATDELKEGSTDPVLSFDFITRSASATSNFIFVYDEAYAGSFVSKNTKNGVLTLDGFGFAATYTDGEGRDVTGFYKKDGANVTITRGKDTYFFVLDGENCLLRGDEYSESKAVLVVDNQVFGGLCVELDGIGGAKIFRLTTVDGTSQRKDIDNNATYEKNGDVFTLIYKDDNETHTLICKSGTFTYRNTIYSALVLLHDEVVYSYLNTKDWSVLQLNNDGTAIKYLADGTVETGTYSLVTETLLYYVNSSATEAFIYVYNKEKGTATPRTYTATAYYTTDLDSLLFSQYGFAIFNNKTRYYYTIDGDGNVTLYHMDENAVNKNKYGYVEESFGKLEDTRNYNDKLYYKNDGFALNFVRTDDNKDKYPVSVSGNKVVATMLTFSPSGGETFSVTGSVLIGGKPYSCTVVKEMQDGKPIMYFTVSNYRFYINVTYKGDGSGSDTDSTYEITGLTYMQSMPSYTYLYLLYRIYSSKGASAASRFTNQYGVISICQDFDENGVGGDPYMNATFGTSSDFLLADGTLLTGDIKNAPLYSGEKNSYFRADFTASDGYNYSLIFVNRYVQIFGTYGYQVYALVREEVIPANDNFTVTVKRVISSEANISVGAYYSIELAKDGKPLEASTIILKDGKLYYVVRETDESGVMHTTYYLLELKEKTSGSVGGEEETKNKALPVYESATVTTITVETVYTADKGFYVDILPGNNIILMDEKTGEDKNGNPTYTTLLIADCSYDKATGTYTLKTSTDRTFTVTVTAGVATVTEITEKAEGTNAA